MSGFQPKRYQQSVLDSVEAYFRACHRYGNADTAFYETTRDLWTQGSKFSPIAGFEPDMPYFCLRVPTGGGKTWLARWPVGSAFRRTLPLRDDQGQELGLD